MAAKSSNIIDLGQKEILTLLRDSLIHPYKSEELSITGAPPVHLHAYSFNTKKLNLQVAFDLITTSESGEIADYTSPKEVALAQMIQKIVTDFLQNNGLKLHKNVAGWPNRKHWQYGNMTGIGSFRIGRTNDANKHVGHMRVVLSLREEDIPRLLQALDHILMRHGSEELAALEAKKTQSKNVDFLERLDALDAHVVETTSPQHSARNKRQFTITTEIAPLHKSDYLREIAEYINMEYFQERNVVLVNDRKGAVLLTLGEDPKDLLDALLIASKEGVKRKGKQ